MTVWFTHTGQRQQVFCHIPVPFLFYFIFRVVRMFQFQPFFTTIWMGQYSFNHNLFIAERGMAIGYFMLHQSQNKYSHEP